MIDWKALYRLVDHKRKCENLSFRKLAAYLFGTSGASMFTRLKAGKAIDAESFVVILNWLKISHRSIQKEGPANLSTDRA